MVKAAICVVTETLKGVSEMFDMHSLQENISIPMRLFHAFAVKRLLADGCNKCIFS
jgi:hypothetical protein